MRFEEGKERQREKAAGDNERKLGKRTGLTQASVSCYLRLFVCLSSLLRPLCLSALSSFTPPLRSISQLATCLLVCLSICLSCLARSTFALCSSPCLLVSLFACHFGLCLSVPLLCQVLDCTASYAFLCSWLFHSSSRRVNLPYPCGA